MSDDLRAASGPPVSQRSPDPSPVDGPVAEAVGRRLIDALVWAAELHATQYRTDTSVPYLAHLLATCALVLEHGGDEDQAIAALLHDAVEDQGGAPRLAEIGDRFGARVARIVEACSDRVLAPGEVAPEWRERKEAYLVQLRSEPPEVLLVTACDKLNNASVIVRDLGRIGRDVWGRFTAGREGQLWYYASLVAAFEGRGDALPSALGAELRDTVERMHEADAAAEAGTSR
jgi:(p)ppGpp synthase/HD superfamily hydrolase